MHVIFAMDQQQNQLIKIESMTISTSRLSADQLDLIKYAAHPKSSIVALRSSLIDYNKQPVFGPITIKYLNRVCKEC